MLLSDHQIFRWARSGGIVPFNPDCLNPNSIDLTIGNEIAVERETLQGFDLITYDISKYSQDNPFILWASEFALVAVAEKIDLNIAIFLDKNAATPSYLSARAIGKSGRAREGLDLLNAGFAESGYQGNLTLAVKNQLNHSAQLLWPGKRFAQLLLSPNDKPDFLYQGHYQGDTGVQASRGHFTTSHKQ